MPCQRGHFEIDTILIGTNMLRLTRNKGETIVITHKKTGEEIRVQVLDVFRNWQVALGVSADAAFLIDREEIHEAKKAEGRL